MMEAMSSDPATPNESLDAPALETAVEETTPAQPLAWPAVAVGVVYAWIVGGFASFTLAANIAVFIPGLLVLIIAFVRPPKRHPRTRPVTKTTIGWWALVLGLFTVMELTDLFLGSTHVHPTWSNIMSPILDDHLAKSILVFIWLRVGWTLLHR
jgi:hypothetical protein